MSKILNLYCGLGGNRLLWGNEHEITSIEYDTKIIEVYREQFPQDDAYLWDAHDYLLDKYHLFDFIWSSPPCPTHGQYRYNVGVRGKGFKAVYPDMKLYEEIIFLKHHFKGKWIVENVKPYYEPLIPPTAVLGRHYIWSNFDIPEKDFKASGIRDKNKISDYTLFDISKSKISNKRQALRNCVDPEMGKYILDCAMQ